MSADHTVAAYWQERADGLAQKARACLSRYDGIQAHASEAATLQKQSAFAYAMARGYVLGFTDAL